MNFGDIKKKENNKCKYGCEVTVKEGNDDKIAKTKCEHKIKDKIVNENYSANKKEYIAREYVNDTIEGIQDNKFQDNKNRTNETYACVVRKQSKFK